MLKFSANLSFLYQDLPFLDRFKAAAADGVRDGPAEGVGRRGAPAGASGHAPHDLLGPPSASADRRLVGS